MIVCAESERTNYKNKRIRQTLPPPQIPWISRQLEQECKIDGQLFCTLAINDWTLKFKTIFYSSTKCNSLVYVQQDMYRIDMQIRKH